MAYRLIIVMLVVSSFGNHVNAQSMSPVNIRQGTFLGLGMHATVSLTQETSSISGLSAQMGYVKNKLGISLTPQFNFIQFSNFNDRIMSGVDFSVVLLGHYRPISNVTFGLGPVMQVTQNVTNEGEWDSVKDISIMGGIGRNWQIGPVYFSLSGLMSYNPSAEDLSIGADISLNYPF